MAQTDVLILGSGMAGLTAALVLARQGIETTIISQEKNSHSYYNHAGVLYTSKDDLPEAHAKDLDSIGGKLTCPRAIEQLVKMGPRCVEEILIKDLLVDFDKNSDGDFVFYPETGHTQPRTLRYRDQTGQTIIDALRVRIAECPNVTLISDQTSVELITLERHSLKRSDLYHKPMCVGAYLYDHQTQEVQPLFAKEVILATGGAGQVYLHTTQPSSAYGDGIAMAADAGARILNMSYVNFTPIAHYKPGERLYPIPQNLITSPKQILSDYGTPCVEDLQGNLSLKLFTEMQRHKADHMWLNVSESTLHEEFPGVYAYCQEQGIDTERNIPIAPAVHYFAGGVHVNQLGQSSVQRLRAIGQVSCTGVHGTQRRESTTLLESLTWGVSCAEDIAKNVRKFAYYFPKVADWQPGTQEIESDLIQQDHMTIKQTMWNYVGLMRDPSRLRRAQSVLQELTTNAAPQYSQAKLTPELIAFRNSLTAAKLILDDALAMQRLF